MGKNAILFILLFGVLAHAGLLYKYYELQMFEVNKMEELVKSKVKESQKSSSGKVIPLREAFQAVYSRPNSDNMIEKVIGPLKLEMDRQDVWEEAIENLVKEAIGALNNSSRFHKTVQGTYIIFLENIISEFQPKLHEAGFEKHILEMIRDAKVEVTKEARLDLSARVMKERKSDSPSELASVALAQSASSGAVSNQEIDSSPQIQSTKEKNKESTKDDLDSK